tara:strand:+ start:2023 stop:2544 length:522 start_codon:yes stop_codon:yes gene_type:complete
MKKVYKELILFTLLITFIISCGNEDTSIMNIDQFSNSGKILSLNYFKTKGFKEVKKYDVSELSGALSAHYGWHKDSFNNPRDYELRFYKDHESALNSKKIIEEVIGENAILATRDVTWKEGNSDRRVNRRGAGSGPGSAKAKYLYYLIYENSVIMCEGLNKEESIKLCNDLVK